MVGSGYDELELVGPYPIQDWKGVVKEGVECVYVIFDAQKRPVRIGETGNLRRRLTEYEKYYWWWRPPTAVAFAYFLVQGGAESRKKFERLATQLVGEHAIFNEQNRLVVLGPKVKSGRKAHKPTGFSGKRVSGFLLGDERHDVDNWIGVLSRVCELAYHKAPEEFASRVSTVRGRKRPYFSRKERGELRDAIPVPGSGIYVESNLSANAIVNLSKKVLHLFQMPDLEIIAE